MTLDQVMGRYWYRVASTHRCARAKRGYTEAILDSLGECTPARRIGNRQIGKLMRQLDKRNIAPGVANRVLDHLHNALRYSLGDLFIATIAWDRYRNRTTKRNRARSDERRLAA